MGLLTSTLFLLIALHKSVAIKITQKNAPTSSSQMQIFDITLNQTERVRRLIPYMNFYVPGNDFLLDNQAYSYNPTNGQKQVVNLYQQQQIPHKQSNIQSPQQPLKQPQQQQLNRGAVYNGITKFASYRPQPPNVIYNTRHQSNKPFELPIQLAPQRVNYNYAKKPLLTPFLADNQVPGEFHPMIYREEVTTHNSYTGQSDHSERPIETQSVQYYDDDDDNEQDLQTKHQSQQHRPIVAQQYLSQRQPEPQLHKYYRIEDHQRQKEDIQHQHQILQHHNINSQPIQIESSTTQSPRQEQISPNYVSYLQPQNFVQFIKSTTQKPVLNEKPNVVYKIIRPAPKPENHFVAYQQPENHSDQPKPIYRVAVDPGSKRILPTSVPNNKQVYQNIDNEYKHQSVEEPTPIFRIQTENKPYQRPKEFYSLDPNDGYGSRIQAKHYGPYREQLNQVNANSHIPKKSFVPYNSVSTTPLPITSTSTQQYYTANDDDDDQNISTESQFRPTIPTSTVPSHYRQHLTETSRINTSTAAPPLRHYRPYSQPKIKFIPRYQPPSVVPFIQVPLIAKESTSTIQPPREFSSTSVSEVLRKLQETNLLPQILNADNIDDSIQTLVRILNNLKQSQHVAEILPQNHQSVDYPEQNEEEDDVISHDSNYSPGKPNNEVNYKGELPGPNTGQPGVDYPILSEIPKTDFNCKEQRYKGFFGDPETNCQVWHYCDLNGGQASFLCPNGTIFSQVALTCDWWFNVKCSTTTQLYVLNERLYKYILPFTPKFPEDYSGPVVDKYLAIKFQEMEEKMRRQKQKGKQSVETNSSQSIKEVHRDEEIEVDPTYSSEAQLDEEGQSHNIDNAIKYPDFRIETTSVAIPNNKYSSTQGFILPKGRAFTTNTTPKTKVEVESEKVEVIEIKSDGSTGHLIPDNYAK